MTESSGNHEPTPEFRASLEREVTRAFLREAKFAPPQGGFTLGRLGMGIAVAAGVFAILGVGLAWGVGTGFAAARAQEARQPDASFPMAVLRKMPIRKAITALTCGAVEPAPARSASQAAAPLDSQATPAQQGIPTVDLLPPSARTTEPLGAVFGVRQVAGGKLLVNDSRYRQVRLFDSTLASSIVTLDSTQGAANGYGARWAPLIGYLGDSSLLPDMPSRTMRVLDGRGQVVRTIAAPNASVNLSATTYVDDRGRLFYAPLEWVRAASDSVPILRADLVSGRVDTVGRVVTQGAENVWFARGADTTRRPVESVRAVNRVRPASDDWAVLADGSIAFVRAADYSIDWVRPDGTKQSTPKLPLDSARAAPLAGQAAERAAVDEAMAGRVQKMYGVIARDSTFRIAVKGRRVEDLARLEVALIGRLYATSARGTPVVRPGSTIADLDGNLWILPPGPMPSQAEPLVYDVVNGRGVLFQRVRVPAGRTIAGFGKGGVVYVVAGDRRSGYHVERTRVSR